MSDEGLQISPMELKFKFELRKQIPAQLSLYNPKSERMAFKIKTTQPKRYSVRPSAGFVEAGRTVEVRITMQSMKEYPPDINNCKDKFLVQSVAVSGNEIEVQPEMFAKEQFGVYDAKLKVILEVPAGPPVTIHEAGTNNGKHGEENEPSPSQYLSFKTSEVPDEAELNDNMDVNQLRRKIEALEKDRNGLRDKLALLELQGNKGQLGVDKGPMKSQIRLIHLLLVAVVAFLIGHFL